MIKKRSSKWLIYIPLILMSIFYLLPMYIMLITGFKGFDEVSLKTMWDLPKGIRFDNFIEAYKVWHPLCGIVSIWFFLQQLFHQF